MSPPVPQPPTLEETRAGAWVRAAFVLGGLGAVAGVGLLALGTVVARLAPAESAGWRAGTTAASVGGWMAWGGVAGIALGVAAVLVWIVLPAPKPGSPSSS